MTSKFCRHIMSIQVLWTWWWWMYWHGYCSFCFFLSVIALSFICCLPVFLCLSCLCSSKSI